MKFFGLSLTLLGILILLLQPISHLTGAFINFSFLVDEFYFIVGLILIIIGFFILTLDSLTDTITLESTKKFEKDIKGRDRRAIQRAIDKIKSGLADEKYRWLDKSYSIRVDKGARIHYQKMNNRIILTDYIPSSEHD